LIKFLDSQEAEKMTDWNAKESIEIHTTFLVKTQVFKQGKQFIEIVNQLVEIYFSSNCFTEL